MKNLICTTLCSAVLISFGTARPVRALTPEIASSAPVVVVVDDDAYTVGTRAMDEHRWPDAVSAFDKVISDKGKRVDSALYWKAYSLKKLGKTPLAVATCDQLHAQFADSPWNKDCVVLSVDGDVDPRAMAEMKANLVQIRPMVKIAPFRFDIDGGDSGVARGSDEDLKMIALNSLLYRDPATALPLL